MSVSEDKMARAKAVQDRYEDQLLQKPNVVGLSIGQYNKDDVALFVLVDKEIPERQLAPTDRIPHELDGVPVIVRQIGKLEALYHAKRDVAE